MQHFLILAGLAMAGFLLLRAVLRDAVKQNDFTVVLVLIIGAAAFVLSGGIPAVIALL